MSYLIAPADGGAGATTIYPAGTTTASPAYAGTFIPEIWSGKIIEKFYDNTVLAAIANTDYEGEIKNFGDTVHIRQKPDITIRPYVAEQALDYERPSADIVDLLIDQGKYFNTVLDDVLEIQADLNMMSMWADDAASQMKIVIDTDVLDYMAPLADAGNNEGATGGRISGNINLGATTTPLSVVSRNPGAGEVEPMDVLIRMGQALDEQNIPESGRWVVVPAWFAALIKQSELRDASLSGDGTSMLRNGRLGMVDRFTIYVSNLLPTGVAATMPLAAGEYALMAGHSHGMTFASQLSKVETLRGESTFGTIMRGLQVYGRKVVDPTALVTVVAEQA